MPIYILSKNNLTDIGYRLKSGSHVYDLAYGSKIMVEASYFTNGDLASMDTSANSDKSIFRYGFVNSWFSGVIFLLQIDRGKDGLYDMITPLYGPIEYIEDSISDEFVDNAVSIPHNSGRILVEDTKQVNQLRWI